MELHSSAISCGIAQLSSLFDWDHVSSGDETYDTTTGRGLLKFLKYMAKHRAFLIFSTSLEEGQPYDADDERPSYSWDVTTGGLLADRIRALGYRVDETYAQTNPNTGHEIMMWTVYLCKGS